MEHATSTRCTGRIFALLQCAVFLLAAPVTGLAAASGQDRIPEEIVFGGDADYPPFEWQHAGAGKGFNVELARAIADHGQREARHRLGNWPEIMAAFRAGEIDILPMFRTTAREQEFRFSDPFHFTKSAAFGDSRAANIGHLRQLSGKSVAVERESASHDRLQDAEIDARLVATSDTLAALRALSTGEAQYAVLNTVVAEGLIRDKGLDLHQLGPPLFSNAYAFAVLRERKALSTWLETAFAQVVSSGDFKRIQAKWANELEARPPEWAEILKRAALVVVPLLVIGVLVVVSNRVLRKQVAKQTIDLRSELERRQAAESEVLRYARHEVVTGLPRRAYFIELAAPLVESATESEPIEIAVIDLRNLGDVTRTFGHAAAETAIRGFGERLASLELPAIGHFGGRTYGAVISGPDPSDILHALSETLVIRRTEFDPVVVAGIARSPEHGADAEDLLRKAEAALYQVENTRAALSMYQASMEPDPAELELAREFRRNAADGVYPVFQPQVSVADGHCVGCEALARWEHERLGMISPARFIPLLERTGLVRTLTRYMIEKAVAASVQLRDAGIDCPIAINVSAHDLLDTDLGQYISTTLERYGARPEGIKIELTETSFASGAEGVNQALLELAALGIRSSIDDFGTGYASLSYLSQFSVDEVKIDRSFVDNLLQGGRHLAIVRAAISMAHEMGLKVVAEGAENTETVTALRREGCDYVQGFVIARPMHLEDLVAFLGRERQAD